MDRSLKWRTIGLIGLVLFCIGALIPSLYRDKGDLPSFYPFHRKITLGLDLQGGLHIEYSIDLNRAISDKASEIARDLRSQLAKDIKPTDPPPPAVRELITPLGGITVVAPDAAKKAEIESLVKSDHSSTIEWRECEPDAGSFAVCFKVAQAFAEELKKSALENAVNTIRDRIDGKGVAEPSVVKKDDRIIVELPGIDENDVAETRELIARTAKLEFKVVDNGAVPGRAGRGAPFMQQLYAYVTDQSRPMPADAAEDDATDPLARSMGIKARHDGWNTEEGSRQSDVFLIAYDRVEDLTLDRARATGCVTKGDRNLKNLDRTADGGVRCKVAGWQLIDRYLAEVAKINPELVVPSDHEFGYEYEEPESGDDRRPYWRSYYLRRTVELTGSAITAANPYYDPNTGKPNVLLEFNREGGRIFGELTGNIVGMKLAAILDNKVKSAPSINGKIPNGRATITMGGRDQYRSIKDRDDLINVLRTGSLPAPLQEEQVANVGASLGRDAIDKAKLSFIVGVILVVLIMIGIYKWSGWIAVGAVIFHNLLTLAVMALFGATLTLPGVAAIVLSVGMTVDGNILIYERIRDELNLGKSVRGAVDLGFTRAFSAILDGQLTTAAAGWVLLQYGSGPIRGFATLLLVGVFTTITTNTWITRIFFDWYIAKKKGQLATISI